MIANEYDGSRSTVDDAFAALRTCDQRVPLLGEFPLSLFVLQVNE